MAKSTPNKITSSVIDAVTRLLISGSDMALAGQSVGVTMHCLDVYARKHPQTADAWREARAKADGVIVSKLYSQAKKGNVTAMIFWLKNRQPKDWSDRRIVEFEVKQALRKLAEKTGIPAERIEAKARELAEAGEP